MDINMPKNKNSIKSAAALSLVFFLSACGGGGGDDSSQPSIGVSNAPVTAPPASSGGRTLNGLVSKSPIVGAEVLVFVFDDFGNLSTAETDRGMTDENGEFSFPSAIGGNVVLKTSGGVFIDESDQETNIELKRKIELGTDEGFMSFVSQGDSTAAITPFTDLLIRRAQNEATVNGGFLQKFGVIKGLVDTELGFDVLNTIPANPVDPASDSTSAQMQYALFLGAFANVVNNISLQLGEAAPTFAIIRAVAEDLSDGDLDGAYFGDPVMVYLDEGGDSGSSTLLPTNVDFNQELARFRNNNFTSFSTTTLPEPTGDSISNEAPTAVAGLDQTVSVGDTVVLSAAGSVDPDGGPLSFSWSEVLDSDVPASDVTLIGATTATPSFVAEASLFIRGNVAFKLTITDNVGFTSSDVVEVNVVNEAPIADAGLDQTVSVGDTVMLSAAGSVDPDGGPLTFSWVEVLGPDVLGSDITLIGATTATPSFVADTGLFEGVSITFELTITDNVGVTSTDTIEVNVTAIIASSIFVIAENGRFIDDGNPIDGGSKLEFIDESTGILFSESGPVAFDWSQTNTGSILIDFSANGGFQEDQFVENGTDFGVDLSFDFGGLIEASVDSPTRSSEIEITEITNTIEIEVLEEGTSSDRVMITILGVRERFDIDTSTQLPDESTTEIEELRSYDASVHIPFLAPLGTQILPTSAVSGTPTLLTDNSSGLELYEDRLDFETDGTGFAFYKDDSFVWSIEPDGHLKVTFAGGEVADYFHFNSLADGDSIGVVYTDDDGIVSSDAFLSVTREPVSLSVSDVAGIFTVRQNFDLNDGTLADQDRILRLYPNGTAQLERVAIDPETGVRIPAFLPFGRCWTVQNNEITLTTAFTGGGINTSAADCADPLTEFEPFIRTTFDVFQVEGTRFRSHAIQEDSICLGGGSTSGCSTALVTDILLLLSDRVPLTTTPAYAVEDSANSIDFLSAIEIDILSNDVPGDAAIDLTSVVIERGTRFGTVSINSTSGLVTYTPGVDFVGDDAFFYRVSDANGLQSSYAPVIISFDPIAQAGVDITARSGDQVTLDASGSAAANNAVNLTWTQLSGPLVSLDDASSATPSFEARGFPVSETTYEFQLLNEDGEGNTNIDTVFVDLPATIPMLFFSAELISVPNVDFGVDVDTKSRIIDLNTDGTGIINHSAGSFALNWTEGGGFIDLDFSGIGGIPGEMFTIFEDVDGLPGDEEVSITETDLAYRFSFNVDVDGKDTADFTVDSNQVRFDVTNSVSLPDLPQSTSFVVEIYDPAIEIPFDAALGGKTLSLLTDVSTAIPTIRNAPELQTDELSFLAGGSGLARHKNEIFAWTIATDGHLEVSFSGGDNASYFNVEARESGDFIAAYYQYSGGDVRTFSNLSFLKDSDPSFPMSGIAGIYTAQFARPLDDGSVLAREFRYIVNLDGTGSWEFEDVDSATGEVIGWTLASSGICASVNVDNEMVWYRQQSMDLLFPGSRQPDVAFCSGLSMADVQIVQTFSLFEERVNGDLAFLVHRGSNDCSTFRALDTGCTVALPITVKVSPEIYNFTPYVGQAPIAVTDDGDFTNTFSQTYNVLVNDIVGDAPLDSATVEIVAQPKEGVATVDPISGMITVTMNTSESNASVFYRVTDTNGNVSTISALVLSNESGP